RRSTVGSQEDSNSSAGSGVPWRRTVFFSALGDSLIAHVERLFELHQDQEGRTKLDRLTSRLERARRKGREDIAAQLEAELWCPPRPPALDYIFTAWRRIRDRTPSGFNGPAPINYPAVQAFCA